MSHAETYHFKDDPNLSKARARERMRALSRRAFDSERQRRGLPVFSMTALLLAGLLFYFDLTRVAPPVAPQAACAYICKTH